MSPCRSRIRLKTLPETGSASGSCSSDGGDGSASSEVKDAGEWRAWFHRGEQVHGGRQWIELDVDEPDGILGSGRGFGDDQGDRLARVDDLVTSKGLESPLGPGSNERQVAGGEHRDHARDLERRRAIDPEDARVGIHRRDDPSVEHALPPKIRGVPGRARDLGKPVRSRPADTDIALPDGRLAIHASSEPTSPAGRSRRALVAAFSEQHGS